MAFSVKAKSEACVNRQLEEGVDRVTRIRSLAANRDRDPVDSASRRR